MSDSFTRISWNSKFAFGAYKFQGRAALCQWWERSWPSDMLNSITWSRPRETFTYEKGLLHQEHLLCLNVYCLTHAQALTTSMRCFLDHWLCNELVQILRFDVWFGACLPRLECTPRKAFSCAARLSCWHLSYSVLWTWSKGEDGVVNTKLSMIVL